MDTGIISQVVTAEKVTEGAGVKVFRSIGSHALRNLDPFLMLDSFSTDNPDDYLAGFPMHPHRGFNTFTYMLDGLMQHEDSMGNKGTLEPGGAQWMKAASGIIHSEMPQQISGRMKGFQLWINLPADKKMSDPAYQEFKKSAIPEIDENGVFIRLLAGPHANKTGPIVDTNTDMHFMDITLKAGASFDFYIENNRQAFLYIYEGNAMVGHQTLKEQQLCAITKPGHLAISSTGRTMKCLLVTGKPIGEPIAQHGPFVMNTRKEIEQAINDLNNGKLVQKKAGLNKAV